VKARDKVTVDVGAVQSGATLTTTREKVEVFQGFPKTLIDQMCTQETAILKFNSIEWSLPNLAKALGAGTIWDGSSEAISEAKIAASLAASEAAKELSHAKVDSNATWESTASEAILAASIATSEATAAIEGTDVLTFGGDLSFTEVAIQLTHSTPKGATITIDIYKAQGNGAVEMTFGDDVHNFPMEFAAMVPFDPCTKTVLDWSGAALAPGKQMFKITIVNGPDPCE
jgi:hypothetical protein